MNKIDLARAERAEKPIGGLAGWLLKKLRVARHAPPRLAVLERIALAPRQSLALIEAEGRRFLVATSPEGTPAFYALEAPVQRGASRPRTGAKRTDGSADVPPAFGRPARVSW